MREMLIAGVPVGEVVLIAQAVASGAMCGLIWFVQIVHYPLFAMHEGPASREYAIVNQRRTGPVVIAFMTVEVASALAVAASPPDGIGRRTALVGVALIAVAWASTFFLQVPLHARLSREGHAPEAVATLVRTNWIRTVAWTTRAVLAAWMLRAAVPLSR